MAVTPPTNVDAGDANVSWTIQTNHIMPTPYRTDAGNAVAHSVLPSAAQLATIGIDISDSTKKNYYFRFVAFTD